MGKSSITTFENIVIEMVLKKKTTTATPLVSVFRRSKFQTDGVAIGCSTGKDGATLQRINEKGGEVGLLPLSLILET